MACEMSGAASSDSIFFLHQTPQRAAIHRLLCFLKTEFERRLSYEICRLETSPTKANDALNHDKRSFGAQNQLPTGTSHHQPRRFDTLQICQILKRWCVEHRDEILVIFSKKIDDSMPDLLVLEGRQQHTGENVAQPGHDLFLLIHDLADRTLECRTMIAHSMLSVTSQECMAVCKSVESILEMLRTPTQEEMILHPDVFKTTEAELFNGTNTSSVLSKERFTLTDVNCKLLLVTELLFAIESSVVQRLQALAQAGADLLSPVLCVSSLCSVLRNEHWHQYIKDNVGVHPRPLVLKSIVMAGGSKSPLKRHRENRYTKSKAQTRKYSHLDMVYLARNTYNHSSFDQTEISHVAQWLDSSVELIKMFNQDGEFSVQIEHLSKLSTFLKSAETNETSCSVMCVVNDETEHASEAKATSKIFTQPATKIPNSGIESSVESDKKVESASASTKKTKAQIMQTGHSSTNLLRIMKKPPSRAFIGREDTLQRLANAFWGILDDNLQDDVEAVRVTILSGHPGIGKSYIALQAVKNLEACSPYQIHFWITASSVELLKSGLATLINILGLKAVEDKSTVKELVNDVKEILRRFSCLLVLDDVVDMTLPFVQELVVSLDPRHFVVVTTCLRDLDIGVDANVEEVKPLPVKDCFQLLEYIIVGQSLPSRSTNASKALRLQLWNDMRANREMIERIVEEGFGQSPLGVSLLGQLCMDEMSLDAVLKRFYRKDEFSTATKDNRPLFADQHSGLDITVRYIVARIQHKKRLLELLYAASIMSPNGIPLRLLSEYHYEGMEEEQLDLERTSLEEDFRERELAELEKTGLLYSEESTLEETQAESESLRDRSRASLESLQAQKVFVFIHQLTQRSLRRVLTLEFGIDPAKVHRSLARGFWKDMQMDDRLPTTFDNIVDHGLKEASRWAECVLASTFARQVLSGEYLELEGEEDRNLGGSQEKMQKGKYETEVIDALLVASTCLIGLERSNSDSFLRRLLLQLIIHNKSLAATEDPEAFINAFLLGSEDSIVYKRMFALCESANITLEYVLFAVTYWGRCQEQSTTVIDRARAYFDFIQSEDCPAGGHEPVTNSEHPTLQVTSKAPLRPDLANVRALLRCNVSLALLINFKVNEASVEAELALPAVQPNQKYYYFTRWEAIYSKAFCLAYQWKSKESVDIMQPVIKETREQKAFTPQRRYLSMLTGSLVHLGKYQEALDLRLYLLREQQKRHANKYNDAVGTAYAEAGEMYTKVEDFEAAQRCFAEHIEIFQVLGKAPKIGVVLFYYGWGKYTMAANYAKQIYESTIHKKNAILVRLNGLSFYAMALMALGSSHAITVKHLMLSHQDLVEICRIADVPAIYAVYTPMMWGRACAWLGEYEEEWRLAQEAAAVNLDYEAVIVDHLYVNIIIVNATIRAIHHGLIENRVSKVSQVSPKAPSKGADGNSGVVEQVDREKDKQHSAKGKKEKTEPVADKPKPDMVSLVPGALKFCLENCKRFRAETDMGWLFEYARSALLLASDRQLAVGLKVLDLLDATRESAFETLNYIVNSQAEKTDWAMMANELLQRHKS